jgi:hypothetical protein
MTQALSKSDLSPAQRRLVELMSDGGFCRIESLQVRRGEPFFEPAPRVIQTLKMGGQNNPREEASLPDFWLKQPVVDLFQTIQELGDGQILAIEVKHGLPFTVQIERATSS